MRSMQDLKWIMHRPPTKRDGNKQGVVLIPNGQWTCMAVNAERVADRWEQGRSAWMPAPPPFDPDSVQVSARMRPVEQPERFNDD